MRELFEQLRKLCDLRIDRLLDCLESPNDAADLALAYAACKDKHGERAANDGVIAVARAMALLLAETYGTEQAREMMRPILNELPSGKLH
jgi:hypothetical protein